jgi:hypothetical protein
MAATGTPVVEFGADTTHRRTLLRNCSALGRGCGGGVSAVAGCCWARRAAAEDAGRWRWPEPPACDWTGALRRSACNQNTLTIRYPGCSRAASRPNNDPGYSRASGDEHKVVLCVAVMRRWVDAASATRQVQAMAEPVSGDDRAQKPVGVMQAHYRRP